MQTSTAAAKERRFKVILLPDRVAEIGDQVVTVPWGRRRVRVPPVRQLPLHWRVTPRRKGYSLGTDPLTAKERADSKKLQIHRLPLLPRTRGDCVNGPRPCTYFRCRHHLGIDVNPESGSIKVNHPDMELEELEDTCSLDVADRFKPSGGTTLEHVGLLLGITLERARQLEATACAEMRIKMTPEDPGRDPDATAHVVEGSDEDAVTESGSDEVSDWEDDECP